MNDGTIYSEVVEYMLNPQNILYNDPTSPLVIGLNMLINNLVYLPLTEQVRCAEDPIHTEMLNTLRKTNVRFPVTQDILTTLRARQLTRDRIIGDPRFLFATELVPTNHERWDINYRQALAFAVHHNRTLVVYPLHIVGDLQNYTIDQKRNLRENNPATLYGYFVSGMPGMVMENICTAKGITNGTICIQHTILFNDSRGTFEEKEFKNEAKLLIENAERVPGFSRVEIGIHPDYIGVELTTSMYEPHLWPNDQTLLEGNIIVLIPFGTTSHLVEVSMSEGYMRDIPIKLHVRNMAVEPGFASTVDKYQGKTAIPLIVRIGKNPRRDVTMPMFLVMLSRVTKGSDLGISPILDEDNLSHLLELQWSENLYLFMNAFNPSTGKLSLPHLNAAQISFADQRRANNNENFTTTSSIQHANQRCANNEQNSTISFRVQQCTPAVSRRRPAEVILGSLESQPPQRIRRNNQNSSRSSSTHSTNSNPELSFFIFKNAIEGPEHL